MDNFFYELIQKWVKKETSIENLFLFTITSYVLIRFLPKAKRFNEGRIILFYLSGVFILSFMHYFGDFLNLISDTLRQSRIVSITDELLNQLFSGLEFFVFSQLLFSLYISKRTAFFVLATTVFTSLTLYAFTITKDLSRSSHVQIGELSTVAEFIVFIGFSLKYIYSLYRSGTSVRSERLILLVLFFGYCLLSAPFFLLARYIDLHTPEYEEFFYRIHLWTLVLLCTGIWYYLQRTISKRPSLTIGSSN